MLCAAYEAPESVTSARCAVRCTAYQALEALEAEPAIEAEPYKFIKT